MKSIAPQHLVRLALPLCLGSLLAACSSPVAQHNPVAGSIRAELEAAATRKSANPAQVNTDQAVKDALLPPLQPALPKASLRQLEPRFDLVVSHAPADAVLMSIVSGTRYNMVVNPKLASSHITVNLRDVTVVEALDTLREQYDFDWRQEGSRIFVDPPSLQTRIFQVNYIAGTRNGSSDLRVISSSITNTNGNNVSSGTNVNNSTPLPNSLNNGRPANGSGYASNDSSKISTRTDSDFWKELQTTLLAIVSEKEGHSITISPQSGMVVVRAMPSAQRMVAKYLKAMQLAVNRQVILEAKIIDVQLNENYQSGINWGGLATKGSSFAGVGAAPTVGSATYTGGYNITTDAISGALGALTGANGQTIGNLGGALGPSLTNLGNGGFALALGNSNFSALLQMLEGQGKVNVLSSPRIATLNNQKAVLKVGTDDFYVTNISVTQTTGTTTTNTPSVTLQPFFSGIALDVTPQIDEQGMVILHVHPSVSVVSEKVKTINAGLGSPLILPLASSNTSETDSVIRAQDGQVVVIGGLMSQSYSDQNNRLPGSEGSLGQTLLGSVSRGSSKRELVILMKTTVVNEQGDWAQDILASRDRSEAFSSNGISTSTAPRKDSSR